MSQLLLSTAWMAVSELAPQPVSFYAAVFFLVNATYIRLIWQLIDRTQDASARVRRITYVRSIVTLCLFGSVSVVALKFPLAALGICICYPIVYLRPAPTESEKSISRDSPGGWRHQRTRAARIVSLGEQSWRAAPATRRIYVMLISLVNPQ
jgi:hypothetical protein